MNPGQSVAAVSLGDVEVRAKEKAGSVLVLSVPHLLVAPGEHVGVFGPSGCGKSSLLHLLAGLLPPVAGQVACLGTRLDSLPESSRDAWRRAHVGFIFQDFHLVPELDAIDNIALPLGFGGMAKLGNPKTTTAEIVALAQRLGLKDRGRAVRLMSRGEQQRVAVARALVRKPGLILADEPTASLDAETGRLVADLIVDEARMIGATLVCASHDAAMLARLPRRLTMAAGMITADQPSSERPA